MDRVIWIIWILNRTALSALPGGFIWLHGNVCRKENRRFLSCTIFLLFQKSRLSVSHKLRIASKMMHTIISNRGCKLYLKHYCTVL